MVLNPLLSLQNYIDTLVSNNNEIEERGRKRIELLHDGFIPWAQSYSALFLFFFLVISNFKL
jgi:hypothetical protein